MPHTVLFYESHSGFFDGAQQSLYLLLKRLDRWRFRPIFVGPEEGLLTRRLIEAGVQTIIARPEVRLSRYGGAILRDNLWKKSILLFPYLTYAWRLRKVMKEEEVKVVHCNSIRSLLTVGLAARLAGVPLIWHHRLSHDLGRWNRVALRLADRVIVVSDSLRENFPSGPGDPRKFVTVYNGVDVTEFERVDSQIAEMELGIQSGWQAIGTTGSLTPRKGQLDLLHAFSTILKAHPRTKLVIIGEARGHEAEAYAERLRAYVAVERLEGRVVFAGWRSDVSRLLRRLDLFVLPSLNEGLPRAILEAMALSLPVVATTVGGNAELVVHGQTGLLVPPQDPDALAAAIIHILQNPELARSMGRRGRQRVKQEFSLGASVRGVEMVIESLLAGQRGTRKLSNSHFTATSQARE